MISVERSEDFIFLFWGCVMAGGIPVLMPSVQANNKRSIAYERFKNAIEILDNVTVVSSDANIIDDLRSSNQKCILFDDIIRQSELMNDYSLETTQPESGGLCVIQFSSGSTGTPKGVMLGFKSILANIKMTTIADQATENDTLIHWMPYFHDIGLFGNHLLSMYG